MWAKLYESEMVLPPKHARIFREALWNLSDQIGWDDSEDLWDDDTSVFGRLTQGQKQSVLLEVGRGLLDEHVNALPVTAVRAAAVYEVYETLQGLIAFDIEETGDTALRQMALEAMDEANCLDRTKHGPPPDREPGTRLSPGCSDKDDWLALIESLRTTVLDDYDFEMDSQFGDVDPAKAEWRKRSMGIPPEYFMEVPEDPNPARLLEVRRDLLQRVRGKP